MAEKNLKQHPPKKVQNSSPRKKSFKFDSSQYIKLPSLGRRDCKSGRLVAISRKKT